MKPIASPGAAPIRTLTAGPGVRVSYDAAGARLSTVERETWALFELGESLSAGGSALAQLQAFDGTQWVAAPGPEAMVHDSLGDKNGAAGDRCWCFFSERSGRWEIVQLECG